MKVWVLAGLFTIAMAPVAMAGEDSTECQLDETRRAAEQRASPTPVAPAASVARPTVAQRDVIEPVRPPVDRRRSGKRIPDAQLIGPRGAL
jgi:hypothetical protein